MSMKSIRDRYGVPAKRGARIIWDGQPATITGSSRHAEHLMVRFDDEPGRTYPIHPTWCVDYLEGDPMTTTDLAGQIRDEWDDAVTDWLNSMDGMVSWDQVDELLDPLAAAVLPVVKAACAETLRGAADLIEDMRNSAQVAEIAAYVPGEVGRQNVIDSFDAAMEEPGDWLRSLADSGQADTYREEIVNDWLAEAWEEGRVSAHDAWKSGGWDGKNPYTEDEEPTR